MKWMRERDLLIAQTMAFVQSVTGKKPEIEKAVAAKPVMDNPVVSSPVSAFDAPDASPALPDIEAMLAEMDPEVEFHPGLPAVLGGDATVFWGHAAVRGWVRDLDEHFAEFENQYAEIRDLGDRVLAVGSTRARGKVSGAEIESPIAYLVESKDGKAIRVRTYLDPEAAFEAAGIRA